MQVILPEEFSWCAHEMNWQYNGADQVVLNMHDFFFFIVPGSSLIFLIAIKIISICCHYSRRVYNFFLYFAKCYNISDYVV